MLPDDAIPLIEFAEKLDVAPHLSVAGRGTGCGARRFG